jgi:hypothetical protein
MLSLHVPKARRSKRVVSKRRASLVVSSVWTVGRRGSPASSWIPRKKASGCAEVSTSGVAKWLSLFSTKRCPTLSDAA